MRHQLKNPSLACGRVRALTTKARKAFFSEEKKQKTFIFPAASSAGQIPYPHAAESQKSFGSFLQKRTS
jgi:hypothetical protein